MEEKQRSPDVQGNILDRAFGWISPKLGYARMAWRNAMRSAYQAGEVSGRSEGWVPVNAKAEQVNQPQRDLIRARSRYAERNSDIVGGPLGVLERNIVSTGFRVQPNTGNEKLDKAIADYFTEWQKPENCDITGAQAFWEMCQMSIRRTSVDGGILYIKVYQNTGRFPYQLQAREVDDLDSASQFRRGDNYIVNGIEVNAYQRPVAYWLKDVSPDGWDTGIAKRIEASHVIALWKKTLPSQIREMSMLAPTIMRANDTEEYLEAVSIKEKILASLSVFIKRLLPSGLVGRGNSPAVSSSDYDQKTGYKKKRVSPGLIMELQPGDDVTSVIPTGQASNAKEFVAMHQRLIGSGQGLSYEATSRDMSEVNYSSARQGFLEDQRTYGCWQQWLIDHKLTLVYRDVITAGVLAGELKIPGFFLQPEKYLRHTWIEPGWSWIDPVKEITANMKAIESGQDNLSNVCARVGYDWREILEQRAKEVAYQKELEHKYEISMNIGGGSVAAGTKPSAPMGKEP